MIRVFPRKTKWTPTDELAFVGDPPLFRPEDRNMPVYVSVTFTLDLQKAGRLERSWSRFYDKVLIGGPALDNPGGEFVSGRFIKPGVTFTSRGCPRRCPWCYVWRREGKIRELPIKPGWIIQDNNLLACTRSHIKAVFDMLREQKRGAVFSGGLDATLLESWHRDLLDTIRIGELWFAADTDTAIKSLERASRLCSGISIEKLRCYVMIGFNGEKLSEAERRLEKVYSLGFLPFAQLYSGGLGPSHEHLKKWKALARKWSRPAAYRSHA